MRPSGLRAADVRSRHSKRPRGAVEALARRSVSHSRLLQYFVAAGGDPAERYGAMIASD
jgi:hypothetical protein